MNILHQPQDIVADKYRIRSRLGEGAFATTYEAENIATSQTVAIKVLSLRNSEDWKILELFEREVKVLQHISHPSIPKYLDYFQVDNDCDRRFYLVQELISGESLAELVQKNWRFDEIEVKKIAMDLLDILEYLHNITPPILHRDIQPKNIIRRSDGKVFLVDFGAVQDVYRNTLTRGGTFVGTLGYMPPEQFRGNVKPASDLYGLGATLLFLLIRRSPVELPKRRMKIDFRSSVSISDHLADWLEKMLEPAIEDRFQSARDAGDYLFSVPRRIPSQSSLLSEANYSLPLTSPSQYIVWEENDNFSRLNITIINKLDVNKILTNIFYQRLLSLSLPLGIILIFFMASYGWYVTLIVLLISIGFTWTIKKIFNMKLFDPYTVLNSLKRRKRKKKYIELSNINIAIDANNFELEWLFLEKKQVKLLKIPIRDISLVNANIENNSVDRKWNLEVWEGVEKYEIESGFTQEEVEWLVKKIEIFLKQN